MSKQVYEAFKRVGADDETAGAAAAAVPSAELFATKGDIADVRAEIADVRAEIADVRAEIAELRTEIAELKGQIAELKGEIADLKGRIAELEVRLGRLESIMAVEFAGLRASLSRQLYLIGAGLLGAVIGMGLLG